MKIVVLVGGLSDERDVSLSSGGLIANALIKNGHEVLILDLYFGFRQTSNFKDIDTLFVNQTTYKKIEYIIPNVVPNLNKIKKNYANKTIIGPNVIKICKAADLVFIALHGSIGENGQIQSLFDIEGISYTGTGYIGCLLAMDKDLSKILMSANGVKTAEWQHFKIERKDISIKDITIELPFVIKPCSNGSSIGVSIVDTKENFRQAFNKALKYEKDILIEKFIAGRELSVGIVNKKALPVIEVVTQNGFYDYTSKYQIGMAKEICPAQLDEKLTLQIKNTALKVHEILRLGYYSRVDFILDNKNNFYCLEANTLPGMTPTSLLPQEAMSEGITYEQLCEMICQSAIKHTK